MVLADLGEVLEQSSPQYWLTLSCEIVIQEIWDEF